MKRTSLMKNTLQISPVILLALLISASTSLHASDQQTTLYSFTGAADGNSPSSGLVSDGAGNLYGTTFYGGSCAALKKGCGTVFELSPSSTGGWTELVLPHFAPPPPAQSPPGTL